MSSFNLWYGVAKSPLPAAFSGIFISNRGVPSLYSFIMFLTIYLID